MDQTSEPIPPHQVLTTPCISSIKRTLVDTLLLKVRGKKRRSKEQSANDETTINEHKMI